MNISIYGNDTEGYAVVTMEGDVPYHALPDEQVFSTAEQATAAAHCHIAAQWVQGVLPYLHLMGHGRAKQFIREHRTYDTALCVSLWNYHRTQHEQQQRNGWQNRPQNAIV